MSEKLGFEGLLGNLVFPQLLNSNPTNKQLIDAAILRGSLELLKPRQPGENLASQASRGLKAAANFGDTVFTQQQKALENLIAQQKANQEKMPSQVTMTEEKALGFEAMVESLAKTNVDVKNAVEALGGSGGFGPFKKGGTAALAANAISVQSANPKLSTADAIIEAAKNVDKYMKIQ